MRMIRFPFRRRFVRRQGRFPRSLKSLGQIGRTFFVVTKPASRIAIVTASAGDERYSEVSLLGDTVTPIWIDPGIGFGKGRRGQRAPVAASCP
ncbi:hypothetical protein [Amycolatopsis lexingtonensis]|uniref:hypothetical protein n=1 Tax=Amycolatopsis lexingtonensis TaxID=218822 RepID=UPI003F6EF790